MKVETYNNEVIDSVAQVMDVFNDIVISRTKNDNTVVKKFRVPIVYGQRDRALKDLENRGKGAVKLPMNTLVVDNIQRDQNRVIDRNKLVKHQDGTGVFNPYQAIGVPLTISFTMESIATSTEDLLRIFSNWCVWFNPDVYVVIPMPNGSKVKCQLIWNNDFSIDWDNTDNNKAQRFTGKSTFTYKCWLFPGEGESAYTGSRIKIINNPQIGVDGRILHSWHSVPSELTYDQYQDNWENRLIVDYLSHDEFPIIDPISGCWHEISGDIPNILGLSGDITSGDTVVLTNDGNLLITNSPDDVSSIINNWDEFVVDNTPKITQ
jgi:hypothetical protein